MQLGQATMQQLGVPERTEERKKNHTHIKVPLQRVRNCSPIIQTVRTSPHDFKDKIITCMQTTATHSYMAYMYMWCHIKKTSSKRKISGKKRKEGKVREKETGEGEK